MSTSCTEWLPPPLRPPTHTLPAWQSPRFPAENHHSLFTCGWLYYTAIVTNRVCEIGRRGSFLGTVQAGHKQGCANIPAKPRKSCPVESFPSGPSRGQSSSETTGRNSGRLGPGNPTHSRKHLDPFYACPALPTQVADQTHTHTRN